MHMLITNDRFIMPVAKGSFQVNFNNFTGAFDADGFEVIVQGRFSQSVEPVNVRNAEVEYASLNDFTGSYSVVSGTPPSFIGIDRLNVEFEGPGGKKLTLTGVIPGGLAQRYTVTGSGTWSLRKRD